MTQWYSWRQNPQKHWGHSYKSCNVKAQDPRALMSKHRERWWCHFQKRDFISHFSAFIPLGAPVDCMVNSHKDEGKWIHSLLIQIPMSKKTKTLSYAFSNNVLADISVSYSSVKLTNTTNIHRGKFWNGPLCPAQVCILCYRNISVLMGHSYGLIEPHMGGVW